ncbi:MAG: ABC transporter ATP-binding protein [Deferribacterota bacterium]|nr:ABC transporter ATP-binding protein [Deferribacterota bacterium]
MVNLININKTYIVNEKPLTVLNNINLKIEKGEFIAIMGPSGSGKTTLMNIIGLLDTPNSGKYYLDDIDISKLDDDQMSELRNKKIGFIFQSFYLIQYLTILENIMLPIYYSDKIPSKYIDRAYNLLENLGLKDKAKVKPNQLSGGQQQRIAIARALMNDPEIILADEPTGQLDSERSHAIMKYIKKLNDDGKTIIVVTHESTIAKYAKKIIKIVDGKIT